MSRKRAKKIVPVTMTLTLIIVTSIKVFLLTNNLSRTLCFLYSIWIN